ncbi:PREDICTED: ATP-binding cassette sub-family G member 4 [Dinoponera quadriceps]|uniref:ATP-binding cassette sub-family G member 4 n=1 Tax=Dinoponera quadriceps TaxID=609295 RepID=A0A6P3Y8Y8_DINQU|nr:PREDICTED: ATP-binding cassette sub-family G member 4 [Dinoponera quadriceps]XP_014486847.1 PREDICTED: ATP-binding cassette sub-family G member 4 [Dinoponera quadriceps]XP_014486848.1 PREDICTED: ATP-binding cassette sub-family G member 4 [Dinoponera quadriceps]XP_014486849.1 PREDICTED: ATP-binding cassette sub-family G member 4 [Dinoponera quadriceps]XP_014486850.1 PREDICTED: ATP-binding cassette sub-family G member 4 [Dinoponera quadriceps]
MEVLIHEASSGQETSANTAICTVDPKSTSKEKREDIGELSHVGTHDNNRESIDIIFEDITYTVNLGCKKGQKEILHEINGRLPGKQLIALMGPSGAGKSTLLDVLSGFRVTGVDGIVFVNGRVRHLNTFRKCSAYITQDDRLEPLLTVLENMRVAADLKLPTDTQQHKKEMIIEEILTTLGLYEHMQTRAGRLSGGQKKRLSIALELVNNPTVMFLDEPTTGLDSSSCMQVVNLLKILARQGRTIVCTIHQPSASLFQLFDLVYVLSEGECLYQGATDKLVPYLESIKLPCPMYHNPADYIIELACGEYGKDKIDTLIMASQNGKNLQWFDNPKALKDAKSLRAAHPLKSSSVLGKRSTLHATNFSHQLKVLLRRGFIMSKRDTTLTHLRIGVNIVVGIMLGLVFLRSGADGSRVLNNYNLLFSVLIHHMMTTMMLTVVTFPMQMSILIKEHFNRWYSLKAFYTALTLIDLPISIVCCILFSLIVYFISAQPMEIIRFSMFLAISLLIMFIGQGTGLMIGAVFNVVNGTFMGPTIAVPLMMFAGFGVSLRDLPSYLKWGSYVSYLRYGLEGFVGAIYGMDRPILDCKEKGEIYCHYKYPQKFLSDIAMRGDQFWNDIIALFAILIITRCSAYLLLRWKLMSLR